MFVTIYNFSYDKKQQTDIPIIGKLFLLPDTSSPAQ